MNHRWQKIARGRPRSGHHAGQPVRINILDAPGRRFGGEVERVLRMADGAFLLVDTLRDPCTNSIRFGKSFGSGLRLVVISKCDRPDADQMGSSMRSLTCWWPWGPTMKRWTSRSSMRRVVMDGRVFSRRQPARRGSLVEPSFGSSASTSCDRTTAIVGDQWTGRVPDGSRSDELNEGLSSLGPMFQFVPQMASKGQVLKAAILRLGDRKRQWTSDLVAIGIGAIEIGDTIFHRRRGWTGTWTSPPCT